MLDPSAQPGSLRARVWPPFPQACNDKRFGGSRNRIEVVFEYGFENYGNGALPTHYITLPADHFDTSKSACVHPVFHAYRHGEDVAALHMQESLISRRDQDDYVDEQTNVDQYRNVAFTALATAMGLAERRSTLPVHPAFVEACYPLMTDDAVAMALRTQPTLAVLPDAVEAALIVLFSGSAFAILLLMRSGSDALYLESFETVGSAYRSIVFAAFSLLFSAILDAVVYFELAFASRENAMWVITIGNVSLLIIMTVAAANIGQTGSVTDVMFNVGFQTKSNFNREFRRVSGMTPVQWRGEAESALPNIALRYGEAKGGRAKPVET